MEMTHFIPPRQRRVANLAAQADTAPVLVHGGVGTGKEVIAKWIHQHGPRSAQRFILASEDHHLAPQIAEAQGGTLLIAEVGNRPLAEQMVLLKFLTTKSVPHPENPQTPRLCNTRIIATSSQALEGRAQGGLFNADLLKKLNIFRIEMPDLAHRKEELLDIAKGILGEITRELHRDHLRTFSANAWQRLEAYHWPGNLRELRNVLRVAVTRARGDEIELKDLPDLDQERLDFRATRAKFEKVYLIELLNSYDWDIDKACQIGRIDKKALLEKISNYGIDLAKRQPSADR